MDIKIFRYHGGGPGGRARGEKGTLSVQKNEKAQEQSPF